MWKGTTSVALLRCTEMGQRRDLSPEIRRNNFRGPDPPNIHLSKDLVEAHYVVSDTQQKSVSLENVIEKNVAIRISLGLQDIQVYTFILQRGIYAKACVF